MGVPSVTKIAKDGVEFVSNLDPCQYYIGELVRAALRDVGKLICRRTRAALPNRTGRLKKYTQYWCRKQEQDLVVGYKTNVFYGGFVELGSGPVTVGWRQRGAIPAAGTLRKTTEELIPDIRRIEAQYLSAIDDGESAVQALISEEEYMGDGED